MEQLAAHRRLHTQAMKHICWKYTVYIQPNQQTKMAMLWITDQDQTPESLKGTTPTLVYTEGLSNSLKIKQSDRSFLHTQATA